MVYFRLLATCKSGYLPSGLVTVTAFYMPLTLPARVIHGDLFQSQGIAVREAFRQGHSCVLVTTDIAARGIDNEGISRIVNLQHADAIEYKCIASDDWKCERCG
jgi:helicase-like protein